ncbi:ATP-binding protein, partial [Arthrospira platensis SPKY1]|nr:ATP-binding protein [Arthrospira platensis SPKY1]
EAATEDILADLRAETADRLEPHGIGLSWNLVAAPGATLSQQKVYALRALVREAVSNTIKHADAQRMDVTIALDTAWLNLNIRDDGKGLPAQTDSLGSGLINMKIRVESFGGEIVVAGGQGTLLT